MPIPIRSATTFYFIRHGETPSNAKGIKQGIHIDDYLDSTGIVQVENAGKIAEHLQLDLFITSHLHRAEETAAILNSTFKEHIPVFHDFRLRERDFGTLTGKNKEEIEKILPNWKEIDILQEYDYKPFGGEDANEVRYRTFTALVDAAMNFDHKNIGIITHAGIIRLLLFHFPDIPRIYQGSTDSKSAVSNTDIYEWEITDGRIKNLKSLIA